jgi:GT2 family glycosyltransferase
MNPRPKNISNFSVVIPTCARPEVLRLCLERLHPLIQNINRCCYEVIVSDDRPSESTRAMIVRLDPLIKYTAGPGRGPAANRNHGASQARGDWLVFLDDDCVPEPGLLNAYQDRILPGESSRVLEGRISALGERTSIDQEAPINEQGGLLWSCNFCIKKELFVQMGGFDEMFMGPAMEDVDLRERLRVLGEAIVFVEQAAVLHPWRPRRGFSFARMDAEARCYFYSKHGLQRQGGWSINFQRFARGIFKNVLKEGPRYRFRGAWRYFWLELHTLLVMAWTPPRRAPKNTANT